MRSCFSHGFWNVISKMRIMFTPVIILIFIFLKEKLLCTLCHFVCICVYVNLGNFYEF